MNEKQIEKLVGVAEVCIEKRAVQEVPRVNIGEKWVGCVEVSIGEKWVEGV